MAIKIGVNGFGRIGRLMLRAGLERGDVKFVGVNDIVDSKTLAHLLKYDSTFGTLKNNVSAKEDRIIVDNCEIRTFAKKNPAEIPWKEIAFRTISTTLRHFYQDRKQGHYGCHSGAILPLK